MDVENHPVEPNGTPHLAEARAAESPPVEAPTRQGPDPESVRKQRKMVLIGVFAVLLFVALIVLAVIGLLQPATPTDKIRDIFIIFMALESLLIGLVLVILIVQLARLINLLQNDIKPILDSTNETVNTLRGTVIFLSDNLTEPIVKLNEFLAAMQQVSKTLRLFRRK